MKKLLAFALAAMMLFGLAASGLAEGETVTLKVWGSQEDQELLGVLVENFKAANPDTTMPRPAIWKTPPPPRTCSPSRTTSCSTS